MELETVRFVRHAFDDFVRPSPSIRKGSAFVQLGPVDVEDANPDEVSYMEVGRFDFSVDTSDLHVLDRLECKTGVTPFLAHLFVPYFGGLALSVFVIGLPVGVWGQT